VQLIVLGMHRSGTSMLTRLLNLMGAYVGPEDLLIGPDKENPKGYWERSDVVATNDAILRLRGCSARVVADWDFPTPSLLAEEIVRTMESITSSMNEFLPWAMKDPRLCLTLPCWMPSLHTPIAVLVYRDPLEIVSSLTKRNLHPAHSLSLWEHYAVGALNASFTLPRLFIRHEKVIADPVGTMWQLFSELETRDVRGLHMRATKAINDFVDANLYRARADGLAMELELSPAQQAVAAILRGERTQERYLEVSATSLRDMALIKAGRTPS
jgi:hypothetical protein